MAYDRVLEDMVVLDVQAKAQHETECCRDVFMTVGGGFFHGC